MCSNALGMGNHRSRMLATTLNKACPSSFVQVSLSDGTTADAFNPSAMEIRGGALVLCVSVPAGLVITAAEC